MDGVELIAAERQRQVTSEGWTPEHDDGHSTGDLLLAAESYLHSMEAVPFGVENGVPDGKRLEPRLRPPHQWPWDASWWKPSDDQVRNLVKAGALIAAEIDRLKRLESAAIASE